MWLLSISIELKDLLWTFVLKTPLAPTVNTVKATFHTTRRRTLNLQSDLCCSARAEIEAASHCHIIFASKLTWHEEEAEG